MGSTVVRPIGYVRDGGVSWLALLALPALPAASASAEPVGAVTEFSSGVSASSQPNGIAAGPDGNLWFTEFKLKTMGYRESEVIGARTP